MVTDILDCETLSGVWVEDHCNQVFGFLRQETGHFVISLKYLLIELLCVLVLKWEIATHHGIQDDTTAPNVGTKTQVLLTFDHFWGCIARTPTCCLKAFSLVIQVTEPKVYNLYAVVVVKQQILRLEISVHNA